MSSLYVVAPVYDEAANVPRLLDGFRALAAEHGGEHAVTFLLVDDGSADGTAETARSLGGDLPLTVLSHERNLGPGAAFATAFEHLAGSLAADDFVLTLEGDNTSRHELVSRMLLRSREGDDVVLASPYMYGGGILHTTPFRVFVSHVANLLVKELLGVHGILTVISFFRLYRGSVLLRLQERHGPQILERRGFECMVEMVLKLVYADASISEVPMVLDTSRRAGKSKLKFFRTARGYLALAGARRRWRTASAESGDGRSA